jgi:hypothetical protein
MVMCEMWVAFSENERCCDRDQINSEARRGPAFPARARLAVLTLALIVFVVSASLAAAAGAAPSAKLSAALVPERLGAGTTIVFGFTIAASGDQVPSPLTGIDLYYPANLGIATSGLGLETCSAAILDAEGVEGCPSQSLMGYGKAIVEVPFGPAIIHESTQTTIFMAHLRNGHLGLLFYATGGSPISAQIVFPGLVLPAESPFGGDLSATIPLVPTLPGAPNAAVVQLDSTIGPMNLTYYERSHGMYLPYRPKGIVLPDSCPHGGFQFAAGFSFEDGTHTSAHTVVPCPRDDEGNSDRGAQRPRRRAALGRPPRA